MVDGVGEPEWEAMGVGMGMKEAQSHHIILVASSQHQ